MPCLNFSTRGFLKLPDFSRFVKHVLSRRNNEIEVSSVVLSFHGKASQVFVKKILDYAFSHNVQKLKIVRFYGKKIEFPFSLFSTRSLKRLTLNGSFFPHSIITTPIWELPALTTLILTFVTLFDDNTDKCVGLFSKCANLKILTLKNCKLMGMNIFNICHDGLSSLTLEDVCNNVNVVTPQLKNLTIRNWEEKKLIVSAPNLSSLHFKNNSGDPLDLSADFLHLEKVDICISYACDYDTDSYKVVSMLQQLHSVKYLTLNLEIIETLTAVVEVISHLPSPFTNLKSLKIYPVHVTASAQTQSEVAICTEVKNYLLDGSVGATFIMVSHEEIRVVKNVVSAHKRIRELQVVLDLLKENNEKDTTVTDQDKAPMDGQVEVEDGMTQPDTKVKWHFGERVTHVESYWEGMKKQTEKAYEKSGCIISALREIEEVLTKLPASHRAKLQARFSLLGAEAGIVMDHMMDNMMGNLKNQHDKKPRFKFLLS